MQQAVWPNPIRLQFTHSIEQKQALALCWHRFYVYAKMKKKSTTVTAGSKVNKAKKTVKSARKNTTSSTREEGRQRTGNNGPQQGSH
jgi:hypothetical protein